MDFGNVQVGNTFEAVLRIANSGNAALTVSGLTGPGGYTSSWTNGTIAAGASQDSTIRFSPMEERAHDGIITITADQTSGTNTIDISGTGTRQTGPRTIFGAGMHLVGSEVASGRYYSDPSSGCYWERLSGVGGSADEILANELVQFDAGQSIVDILSGDRAFKTDAGCGTWFQTERRGLQADITPGMWLVGRQITPGTYRASVSPGCYWERLRHFQGNFAGIIASDFIDSAGQQDVEIRASDAGFHSDGDCGTWTRVTTVAPALTDISRVPSRSEIEANRRMYRRRSTVR